LRYGFWVSWPRGNRDRTRRIARTWRACLIIANPSTRQAVPLARRSDPRLDDHRGGPVFSESEQSENGAGGMVPLYPPGLLTIAVHEPTRHDVVSNLSIASATLRHASASDTEAATSTCSRAICTALAPNRSISSSATRLTSSYHSGDCAVSAPGAADADSRAMPVTGSYSISGVIPSGFVE
jgi:hypothetical protein